MTRVSDLAQSQLLISELNRANSQLNITQLQVSSGKKAQYFKDIADQAGVLLSAKRVLDQNANFSETATELAQKLDQQDLALRQLGSAADDLRENATTAVANGNGVAFMDSVDGVFQSALSALNTKINGQYIFGGTRTDTSPVNITTLNALGSAGTIAGIFDNNNIKASAAVDQGTQVIYGMTASDLGTALMTTIQAIKQFSDSASGPLTGQLTPTQQSFLEGQLTNLQTIAAGINQLTAQNGVTQNTVERISNRLNQTTVATQDFVSNIEDVDLPTALTQLQQNQVAVQAAAHITAQLGQLSLLNFLPL